MSMRCFIKMMNAQRESSVDGEVLQNDAFEAAAWETLVLGFTHANPLYQAVKPRQAGSADAFALRQEVGCGIQAPMNSACAMRFRGLVELVLWRLCFQQQ